MKSVKRRPSPQTKAKKPGTTRAVKRRATPPRKAKKQKHKKPHTAVIRTSIILIVMKIQMRMVMKR
jgi:hypothetical protein